MIHPDTTLQFISPEVGYGVVATRRIPRGTLTWVLDELDQRVTPERAQALGPDYAALLVRYGYRDGRGDTILSWDHGRFVNHSCRPTCASGCDETFEVAIRDIEPGEQLTDDYGELDSVESFTCRCGEAGCRGVVRPEDRYQVDTWLRERVRVALAESPQVPQPLANIARAHPRLREILAGAEALSGA